VTGKANFASDAKAGFDNNVVFDAVQMPLNVLDAHYDGFEKKALLVLVKNNITVLGMKLRQTAMRCGLRQLLLRNACNMP
jgi:hypothetical protein